MQRGTHSRSYYYLRHLVVESFQALQLCETLDCPSIFDAVAKKLVQDLYLLSCKIVGWEGTDDRCKVRDSSSAYLGVFIVDVFADRLYDVYEGDLAVLKLYE